MSCEICKKKFTPSIEEGAYYSEGKPHLCLTCGKSFSLKIQLKRHMQTHEGGKPYTCYACEKLDNQSYNLRLSKKANFTCDICLKTFNTNRALLLHASKHNFVDCDTCNKSFKTVTEMKKHSARHKRKGPLKKQKVEPEKMYECHKCDRSFTQLHVLEKHSVSHNKFLCDKCNAKFSSLKSLDDHCCTELKVEKSLDNDNSKKHVCSICNKTFARKSALEGHVVSHFSDKAESAPEDDTDNDADFLCNFLSDKEKNDSLKEMCLPKLKIRRSYPCEVCEKICASEKILEKHMLSHKKISEGSTNDEKKTHMCRICNKIFFSKIDYKNHKFTHNKKEGSDNDMKKIKTYACKICCKVFSKKKHLKKHFKTHSSSDSTKDVNSTNLNEILKKKSKRNKEFSCGICSKLFAGEICLKKHELKHTDSDVKKVPKVKKVRSPPSLICPFCNEDFTGRRFAFMRHKISHTPEICGICDERFVDRAALREHLKTHIGTDEARKFLECSQKAQNFKTNLQNPEGKVEYIYLVLR